MAVAALSLPVALGCYLGYLQVSGNFHTVLAGQLYRSGQPTAGQLRDYVRDYRIRTVVNLRGQHATAPWYEAEIAQSAALGVRHVDFRMSASRRLSLAEAAQLADLLRALPKPILIHCQGGADRSGLAAAIYLHEIAGEDLSAAGGQISLFYGHIAIPYLSSTYAMDETWTLLEQAYGRDGTKRAAGL